MLAVVAALVAALAGAPAASAGAEASLPEISFATQYICWESMPAGPPAISAALAENQKCAVRVGLSMPSKQEVVFTYRTEAGSAKPPADYVDVREGKSTIVPGAVEVYITLEIVPDRIPEPEEYFTLLLLQASGANIGRKFATVTIRDAGQSQG